MLTRVLIAEGVANAAVGAEVDKSPAVAAMGKSNLLSVALARPRAGAPDAELIILADNDLKLPKEAHEAAVAVGGRVVVPELDGRKCDLWDVWNEHGIEAVSGAIANAKSPAVASLNRTRKTRQRSMVQAASFWSAAMPCGSSLSGGFGTAGSREERCM